MLDNLNTAVQQTNQHINTSTHIIITLGTSWVYRLIELDTFVANCHKVPQKKFLKEILSIDEIVESLESMIGLIRDVNPHVNFIFTGLSCSTLKGWIRRKSTKQIAFDCCHSSSSRSRKKTHYFPSYEILMDELRDYRFYKEDMIHPNQTAIDYIWENSIRLGFLTLQKS